MDEKNTDEFLQNSTRCWKPLAHAACLIWDSALCLTCCCHLNSELVQARTDMSALCQTGGGGEYVCCRRRPPWPLRRPQNSPLALLSLLHLSPAICLVQPWQRRMEKWSLTGTETESSLSSLTFFSLGSPGIDGCSWAWYLCWCSSSLKSFIKNEWQNRSSACLYFFSLSSIHSIRKT